MTEEFRKVRIFCASPSDVKQERKILEKIVKDLNQTGNIAEIFKVQLEILDQYSLRPSLGRPQQVVLNQLPVEQWDLFIGILWLRFGSPTGKVKAQSKERFESGTEEEFTMALEHKKSSGKPEILVYRCTKPIAPTDLDLEQFKRVNSFFENFQASSKHPGLVQQYQSYEDFEQILRKNLLAYLRERYYDEVQTPKTSLNQQSYIHDDKELELEKSYLLKTITYCNQIPLAAITEEHDHIASLSPKLEQVYIELNTNVHEETPIDHDNDEQESGDSAYKFVLNFKDLVILGNPGGGKTTFINKLMIGLARMNMGLTSNLQAWPHGPIFPIKVVLNELATFIESSSKKINEIKGFENRRRALAKIPLLFIARKITEEDSAEIPLFIKKKLNQKDCIIVFDGLDEVGPRPLTLLRKCLDAFCKENLGNRFIITCRTRSFSRTIIPSIFKKTIVLQSLTRKQIKNFVVQWYDSLVLNGFLVSAKADKKKEDLFKVIMNQPSLHEMAVNPFLLTTMATIHSNNVELPSQKVRLYKKASNLLLKRWQEYKTGISLTEAVGIADENILYHAIWELAYFAETTKKDNELGNIPKEEAFKILEKNFSAFPDPSIKANQLLILVNQTAGLLINKGTVNGDIYSFPHKTFQEYFAGCYILKRARSGFKRTLKELLKEGSHWYSAAELGIQELLYNDRNENQAKDVIYSLGSDLSSAEKQEDDWRSDLWAAKFAILVGKDKILFDEYGGGAGFLTDLASKLEFIVNSDILNIDESIDAGYALGKLGDPRKGVVDFPLDWVSIAEGEFDMGCHLFGPIHQVQLSAYQISKYPITNSQFEKFKHSEGYHKRSYWSKEGWDFRTKSKILERSYTLDPKFNLPNQPVVGVSWYEAEAFCNWLSTITLGTDSELLIRLPTEAEWEFAAKGLANTTYPWGAEDSFLDDKANFKNNIGQTTPVGCYPRGKSVQGVFDLVGNVWEWCFDWFSREYYQECFNSGVVKDPSGPRAGSHKVTRGGSWNQQKTYINTTCRLSGDPCLAHINGGFRVVLVEDKLIEEF